MWMQIRWSPVAKFGHSFGITLQPVLALLVIISIFTRHVTKLVCTRSTKFLHVFILVCTELLIDMGSILKEFSLQCLKNLIYFVS